MTRMLADESMSFRGSIARMMVKESMSYCEPMNDEISLEQICARTGVINAPSSIEDAMKVLEIEVQLRQGPEYLNKTSEYIRIQGTPPLDLDHDL